MVKTKRIGGARAWDDRFADDDCGGFWVYGTQKNSEAIEAWPVKALARISYFFVYTGAYLGALSHYI